MPNKLTELIDMVEGGLKLVRNLIPDEPEPPKPAPTRHHIYPPVSSATSAKVSKIYELARKAQLAGQYVPADCNMRASDVLAIINGEDEWKPGDACGSCGSHRTFWSEDPTVGAVCGTCGATDADE